MDTFKIIKKGSGNFWHVHNNNSKTVNLSDFEIVLDSVSQTFSISMPNGSNVPSFSVSIFYIIVIDETDGSVEETFGSVESLRLRLIELGYTPYISGNNVTEAPIDGLTYGRKDAQWVEIGGGVQQYKFLLSQSGGDDPQTATSGTLTQGVTYEIVAFETGDDFTLSGAPNNTVGTKWIANNVAPTWSNGSEIGWNNGAPVVVGEIGNNTIGMITWSRVDVGIYQGNLVGIYDDVNNFFSIVSQAGDGAFYKGNIQYDGDPDYFILNTFDFATDPNDDMLFRTSILIEKN